MPVKRHPQKPPADDDQIRTTNEKARHFGALSLVAPNAAALLLRRPYPAPQRARSVHRRLLSHAATTRPTPPLSFSPASVHSPFLLIRCSSDYDAASLLIPQQSRRPRLKLNSLDHRNPHRSCTSCSSTPFSRLYPSLVYGQVCLPAWRANANKDGRARICLKECEEHQSQGEKGSNTSIKAWRTKYKYS
jgi:hypothetical protein